MPGTQHSAWLQWRTEDAAIQNTGLGAGKAETQGAASFFRAGILQGGARVQGQGQSHLLQQRPGDEDSDLVFTRSLDDHNLDYESVDIGPEVQVRVEEISGSLVSIPAEPNP